MADIPGQIYLCDNSTQIKWYMICDLDEALHISIIKLSNGLENVQLGETRKH